MRELITDMFEAIDAKNHDVLPRFFADSIVYERPGYPPISGLDRLIDFYKNRRIIAAGGHRIEDIVFNGNKGVSIGRFEGQLKNGSSANERFADAYTLEDGKIAHRTTYFFRAAI